jgi:phenylacetate-CoA ligase
MSYPKPLAYHGPPPSYGAPAPPRSRSHPPPLLGEGLFSPECNTHSTALLERALRDVAFYRRWQPYDPGRGHPPATRYAAMPVLTKQDLREHSLHNFVPSDRDLDRGLASGEIALVTTSGTTGDRVTNIWNQTWWDASERASWQLNSHAAAIATGDHREAILTSSLSVGYPSDDEELPMEKRRLSRFLFLNEKSTPLLWTPRLMDRMVRELDAFQPVVLEANPSYLARLCRYAVSCNQQVYQPQLIVFTYEYPLALQRQQIRRVFDAPLVSSYGTTEVGYVFMECEAGHFHQNSEFCHVDFQPFTPKHGGPTLGRILVTTFNNPWYYLLRFDVGDLVRVDEQARCSCGRASGWVLTAMEGRAKNVTFTCSGRAVTLRELDTAVSALAGIDEYQLLQTAPDAYRLHLVSQRADKDALTAEARRVLHALYGREARLSLVFESALTPEASGKYCVAQTLYPTDLEALLDPRWASRTGCSEPP